MGLKPEEKRASIRVREDLKRKLKALASTRGVELQELADEAIKAFLGLPAKQK